MNIITKVVANRINTLSEVIDVEHNAFVTGRFITNNAFVAIKCFHWLKKEKNTYLLFGGNFESLHCL